MSTDATSFSASTANGSNPEPASSPANKGKGKVVQDDVMDEDEEDDEEDEEDGEEDEDEEMAEEEEYEEIDPSAIIPSGRRTRGVRVDYSSAEALAKAGLKPEEAAEDDEHEQSFVAKDDEMHD